jgi:TPR repeat protein
MCVISTDAEEQFEWAKNAHEKNDRNGTYQLGRFFEDGVGCEKDVARACELYRMAAEMDCLPAQRSYGNLAFGELDWLRFYWKGRAASRGYDAKFGNETLALLPSFERGEHGRSCTLSLP